METITTIPTELQAIIPRGQLFVTKKYIREYQYEIQRLAVALKLCPAIGATEKSKEHPAIFYYFLAALIFTSASMTRKTASCLVMEFLTAI